MLTIVSWNIQYGKGVDGHIDLSRIAREILIDGSPDLICLQEVSQSQCLILLCNSCAGINGCQFI